MKNKEKRLKKMIIMFDQLNHELDANYTCLESLTNLGTPHYHCKQCGKSYQKDVIECMCLLIGGGNFCSLECEKKYNLDNSNTKHKLDNSIECNHKWEYDVTSKENTGSTDIIRWCTKCDKKQKRKPFNAEHDGKWESYKEQSTENDRSIDLKNIISGLDYLSKDGVSEVYVSEDMRRDLYTLLHGHPINTDFKYKNIWVKKL